MATETAVEVVMPQMGVSVAEGTVTKWLKQEGDVVAADEPLLEISTDKVDTEVPSPGSGILQQILVPEGHTVEVGTRLALIAAEGSAEPPPSAPPEAPAVPLPPPPPIAPPAPEQVQVGAEDGERGLDLDGKSFVSPVVARIAGEHGVDVSRVPGSGRGGRVTKKDILAFVEAGGAAATKAREEPVPAAAQAPAPPLPAPPSPSLPQPQTVVAVAGETVEPMSAMRKGIAEHMRRSLDTSAHVTSAIEVDMSKVVAVRERLKREYQQAEGINPTYLAFVARATIETLRNYPYINGEIRGEQIVTKKYVNLGIAVELADGKGLIVPVIKQAESLNLLGLARAIADLAQRARDKQLLPDDVQGGTFTITNPGGYGTFHGTPIISQPQAAILGTYALVKRPWVVQDSLGEDVIAIRPIMNITLTYDHRLVDGALAGRFLRDLHQRLESWDESAE